MEGLRAVPQQRRPQKCLAGFLQRQAPVGPGQEKAGTDGVFLQGHGLQAAVPETTAAVKPQAVSTKATVYRRLLQVEQEPVSEQRKLLHYPQRPAVAPRVRPADGPEQPDHFLRLKPQTGGFPLTVPNCNIT